MANGFLELAPAAQVLLCSALKVRVMEMSDRDTKVIPPGGAPEQSNSSNVFTGTQREALINEIVHEMRKDLVKQDARTELEQAARLKLISKFFQHPAVLLVIGFAVTGLLGGWLANSWQSKEWDRQQLRLLVIHGFELKYKLIEDITRSIGERNAAALGIITRLLIEKISDQELMKAEEELKKNWQKVDYDWRANSLILQLKIETLINSQSAAEILKGIIKTEQMIGARITLVTTDLSTYRGNQKFLDEIISYIKETGQEVKKLVIAIAEEARKDVQSRQP